MIPIRTVPGGKEMVPGGPEMVPEGLKNGPRGFKKGSRESENGPRGSKKWTQKRLQKLSQGVHTLNVMGLNQSFAQLYAV